MSFVLDAIIKSSRLHEAEFPRDFVAHTRAMPGSDPQNLEFEPIIPWEESVRQERFEDSFDFLVFYFSQCLEQMPKRTLGRMERLAKNLQVRLDFFESDIGRSLPFLAERMGSNENSRVAAAAFCLASLEIDRPFSSCLRAVLAKLIECGDPRRRRALEIGLEMGLHPIVDTKLRKLSQKRELPQPCREVFERIYLSRKGGC